MSCELHPHNRFENKRKNNLETFSREKDLNTFAPSYLEVIIWEKESLTF